MKYTPRDHQLTGAAFLASRGVACLWDDPGLGKTGTSILALEAIYASKVLVICPAVVRENWAIEMDVWAPSLPVVVIPGMLKQAPGRAVTIISHANIASAESIAWIKAGAPYDAVIVDEADAFRAYQAQRTRYMMAPPEAEHGVGVWAFTRALWLLTGTPLVNSAGDLYPLFSGPLRAQVTWWDFCSRFADLRPDPSVGFKAVGVKNTGELADLLRPHVLRRTALSIGLNLPPLNVVETPLDVVPGALVHAMAGLENWNPARLLKALEINDEIRDPAISRVRHALGLAKADAAAARIDAVLQQGGGPIVAFFQHTSVRDRVLALLPHWRVGTIDGKVSRKQLLAAKEAFQAGDIDLLLVQTQAGGVGLTLTRSNRAVVIELPWTSTALLQAIARIHRISQLRPCLAEIVRINGCWLEDVLSTVVRQKQRASDELLGLLETTQ